jgi:putative DNA primase/helicase
LPFTVFLTPQERDRKLAEKLKAEQSGILAWAVRGCLEWQRIGLAQPAEIDEATQKYRDEMDPLADFFANQCELEENFCATSRELYEGYFAWAGSNASEPISQKAFGTRLGEKVFQRYRSRIEGVLTWFWAGIKLSS